MFEKFIEAINNRNRAREERDKAMYQQGWHDCAEYFRNRDKAQVLGDVTREQLREIADRHGVSFD